jgi:hypothetical protein
VATTPHGASSAGISEVSTRTFSWRSRPRRQVPWPSATNVVASLTILSGASAANSVMMAQSGPVRATVPSAARIGPYSRSQMSIASTPPGRSAPATATSARSTAAASGR